VFSPADVAELVNTFRAVGFTRQDRLAVLYHFRPASPSRLFAMLSTLHGYAVRAFADFEKALLWLPVARRLARSAGVRPGRSRCPCDSRSARRSGRQEGPRLGEERRR